MKNIPLKQWKISKTRIALVMMVHCISNKLVKSIKCSVSKSLTIVINQVITTGIFLEAFKVSKVTPIF